ncbi:hypothetical protein RchiOBHm_Chr7g0177341 [Rosa chinensis]|uniref:Uncharacterized protein n=1 Tax=Rosa chinensis TaxID=74649 RepID=A0A2P6P1J2_ROSCH|nr:hypothetical protein RchiOBHm_Chr7g0177341 [Rosa chinensis]
MRRTRLDFDRGLADDTPCLWSLPGRRSFLRLEDSWCPGQGAAQAGVWLQASAEAQRRRRGAVDALRSSRWWRCGMQWSLKRAATIGCGCGSGLFEVCLVLSAGRWRWRWRWNRAGQ